MNIKIKEIAENYFKKEFIRQLELISDRMLFPFVLLYYTALKRPLEVSSRFLKIEKKKDEKQFKGLLS